MEEKYERVVLRAPEENMERKQNWAKKEDYNAVSTKTSANPMRNSVSTKTCQPYEELSHWDGPSWLDPQFCHYTWAVTGRGCELG